MAVPSRLEAAAALAALRPPAWFVAHACAVADVADWLAVAALRAGRAVERDVVATAALLHDVDKLPAAAAPRGLRHGDGSAAWLTGRGWTELAAAVRDHPVTRLAEAGFGAWPSEAPLEARIVAYADKRAGARLEPMAARFAAWRRRYPAGPVDAGEGSGWDDAVAATVTARAALLERAVCAAAGTTPAAVRRLRWARRALAAALR